MIVVSGCPRSGTSLMMDLLRVALGEDRILGKKFPHEEQIEAMRKKHELESDKEYAIRMYIIDKTRNEEEIRQNLKETMDMNPNGFWEMLYTVQGCHYRFFDADRLESIEKEKDHPKVCKIVSQGLAATDPRYITKMIYMIRHPRSVAKSQERLKRDYPFSEDGKFIVNGEEIKVHTPEMYIHVTAMAARYLNKYSHIPVLYVFFDDLLSNPTETLQKVRDFLGEGDFEKASAQIEPKLKRSEPQDIESPFWEDAEFIYDHFAKQDFEAIFEYLKDQSRMILRKNRKWMCVRSMSPKVEDECLHCKKSQSVADSYRKAAEKRNVEWKNEPCIFECLYDVENPLKSMEESVRDNHWLPEDERKERYRKWEVSQNKCKMSEIESRIKTKISEECNAFFDLAVEGMFFDHMGPSSASPINDKQ